MPKKYDVCLHLHANQKMALILEAVNDVPQLKRNEPYETK